MKYTSVKFCFVFNFCKKNRKVGFFTSKYAKNRRFHYFFGLFTPRNNRIAACQFRRGCKIGKACFLRLKAQYFTRQPENLKITFRSGSFPPG